MICRRCGMDSSTTDTCEWCKKPMLPPGAAISAQAKEQILKEKAEAEKAAAAPAPPTPPPAPKNEEITLEDVARPGATPPSAPSVEVPGLTALGSHITEVDNTPQASVLSTTEQTINDSLLLPLGSMTVGGKELEANADKTLYVGNDENIIRPIDRPSKDGSQWVIDASGRKRRVVDDTPEIPEKVRMMRGTMQGAIISLLMAVIQYFVVKDHKLPSAVIVFPVPGASDGAFTGALIYGLYMTVLMGFMLSAVLVAKKWGAFVGFLLGGIGLGILAMLNNPNMPWSMINGMLAGIFVGRTAVKGVKRIVTV